MCDDHDGIDWLEILEAIAEGVREAWGLFYGYYRPWAVQTAKRYTRDENLAEDAADCALFKFFRDVGAIIRCLANAKRTAERGFTANDVDRLIKFFLEQRIRRCLGELGPKAAGQNAIPNVAAAQDDDAERISFAEALSCVEANLIREILEEGTVLGGDADPQLTELERDAARLKYLDGKTTAGVAELMRVEVPTVVEALRRARGKLKENLKRLGDDRMDILVEILTGIWPLQASDPNVRKADDKQKVEEEPMTDEELHALRLKYLDGLSHAEAAAEVQVSETDYETMLQSGQRKLREVLDL